MKTVLSTILLVLFAAIFWPLKAYMMSSANYRIDLDSISIGGGLATSTSYRGEDTVGETATGDSESANYKLKAGYQQMKEVYISMSVQTPVQMSPALMSITGGTANGSSTIEVKTDDSAGYQLQLNASTIPAMASSGSDFPDYSPAAAVPDYDWFIGDANSEFGYTVSGSDAIQLYKNSSSMCDQSAGTADGSHCWNGFSGGTSRGIAQSAAANHPAGAQTTVYYRGQIKSNGFQEPGTYSAVITATATAR